MGVLLLLFWRRITNKKKYEKRNELVTYTLFGINAPVKRASLLHSYGIVGGCFHFSRNIFPDCGCWCLKHWYQWQHHHMFFFTFCIWNVNSIWTFLFKILKFRTHRFGLNVLEIYFSLKLTPHCMWMTGCMEWDGTEWKVLFTSLLLLFVVSLEKW